MRNRGLEGIFLALIGFILLKGYTIISMIILLRACTLIITVFNRDEIIPLDISHHYNWREQDESSTTIPDELLL